MINLTIANENELHGYHKGIFCVLSRVDIYACKEALKVGIKSIYKLSIF